MTAVGIHAHPTLKLGARPPVDKPRLMLGDFLTGNLPDHPIASDDTKGVVFGLDRNDRYGVCVPTGVDNYFRMVTKLLTGKQSSRSWAGIKAWYMTQNPGFNENDPGGPGDGGMVIQDFLAYLQKAGFILGFASLNLMDEEQVKAAEYILLGTVDGVTLQTAQQTQTVWDWHQSGTWGGHCVMAPRYLPNREVCISWAQQYQMTEPFLYHQREEVYAVVTKYHVAHPGFRAGFDLPKFTAAVQAITGRPIPAP